jgi:hypothetical protein
LTLLALVLLALLRLATRLLALTALLRLTLLALLSALRLAGAALLLGRSGRATLHLRAALGGAAGLTAGFAARHLLG